MPRRRIGNPNNTAHLSKESGLIMNLRAARDHQHDHVNVIVDVHVDVDGYWRIRLRSSRFEEQQSKNRRRCRRMLIPSGEQPRLILAKL